MSYGLPVVATPAAVEGMHLVPGDDVLVAEDAADFASAVARAYRDEALWARLSAGGRENVRRHFSRDVARGALAELLELARTHGASGIPRR
jgi:glycosyltransferase involved in cell wall biosynthesis